MDDKQKLISEIEGRIQANEESLKDSFAALGGYAAEEVGDAFSEGELRGLLNQIKEFRAAIEITTQTGKRILEIEDRLEEIHKSLRRLENEGQRLEKEHLPVYEEFGRVCAGSYAESDLPPEAREVFLSIQELRQKEASANEEIANLKESSKDKPFLSRVFGNGKAAVLGSSLNFKLKNLGKLYQTLGRIVLGSLETIPPEAFLNVYRTNRKQLQDNEAEGGRLKGEVISLEQELESLGVERRFQKRLKDLELQNEKNFSSLEQLLVSAGKEIFEHHKDFRSGKAEAVVEDIHLCMQRTAEYAEEKKKLEAAVEYDKLTRKLHDMREALENEEKAASSHRAEAERLKDGIAKTEKEREKFEHLSRGEKRRKHDGSSKTKE
ncbi:MAG: hypothetical protein LBT33_03520 [Spirochaetia bacterium]|jgi:hypothetical protein|nr:hypothetical protein [Spirochaetia bacterium]